MRLFCCQLITTISFCWVTHVKVQNFIEQKIKRLRLKGTKTNKQILVAKYFTQRTQRCKERNEQCDDKNCRTMKVLRRNGSSIVAMQFGSKQKRASNEALLPNLFNAPKSWFRQTRQQMKFRSRRSLMHLDFEM